MSNSNPYRNVDLKHLQKMVFIYNAVLNGWSVKQLPDGRYEFTKPNTTNLLTNEPQIPQTFSQTAQQTPPNSENNQLTSADNSLDHFIYKFIRNNMNLDKLKD